MAKPPRQQLPGGFYHVTLRGYGATIKMEIGDRSRLIMPVLAVADKHYLSG